jgi:hypothetical protein
MNALLNLYVETLDGTELNFISVSRKNVSLDVNHVYIDMELCSILIIPMDHKWINFICIFHRTIIYGKG